MEETSKVYEDSSIEELELSRRVCNALYRSGIKSVRELLDFREEVGLKYLRNIGVKSEKEINNKLSNIEVVTRGRGVIFNKKQVLPERKNGEKDQRYEALVNLEEVIQWQRRVSMNSVAIGLLHQEVAFGGKTISSWLSDSSDIKPKNTYKALTILLENPLSVSKELTYLFKDMGKRNIHVLVDRFSKKEQTLQDIGDHHEISRERVRQIVTSTTNRLKSHIRIILEQSVHKLGGTPALLRIQTAINHASDMGDMITYDKWYRTIRDLGLLGVFDSKKFESLDPISVFITVLEAIGASDMEFSPLRFPANLNCAVQLKQAGYSSEPAKAIPLLENLSNKAKKNIKRHARFTGGINARWLSEEYNIQLSDLKVLLSILGFEKIAEDWYIQKDRGKIIDTSRFDVFHNAVRKMFLFCGPLPVEEICSGIRHAAYRTSYPVPPPSAMKIILDKFKYPREENLYYWDGDIQGELSRGEKIIYRCIKDKGPIVHHSLLAQAIIDSELSFASLHKTLNYSPLFKRIDTGLYKMRGESTTGLDLVEAKNQSERHPVNPKVTYDKNGFVTVELTLGVLSPGTGTILSDQLPNLTGEWKCYVDEEQLGKMEAADNEFRHLTNQFEVLNLHAGDRARFTFNTWNREVFLEKID